MSVIIEDEEGIITLYCKGAESAVIPLVGEGPTEEILNHVADFAMVKQRAGVQSSTVVLFKF